MLAPIMTMLFSMLTQRVRNAMFPETHTDQFAASIWEVEEGTRWGLTGIVVPDAQVPDLDCLDQGSGKGKDTEAEQGRKTELCACVHGQVLDEEERDDG